MELHKFQSILNGSSVRGLVRIGKKETNNFGIFMYVCPSCLENQITILVYYMTS